MQSTRKNTTGQRGNVSGGKKEAKMKKIAAPQNATELQKRTSKKNLKNLI
jgi:hypothetical protein